jgi:hypothetical protein
MQRYSAADLIEGLARLSRVSSAEGVRGTLELVKSRI